MTEISRFSCGRGRGENRIALEFSKIDHRTHPENLKLYSPGNPKLYTPETKLYSPEKPRLYTPGNPKLYTRDFSSHLVRSFHLPPGGVRLGPGRSQEVRASPELENGSLRTLGEAWTTSSRLRHFLSDLVVFCGRW